jgi:hypothetical protein
MGYRGCMTIQSKKILTVFILFYFVSVSSLQAKLQCQSFLKGTQQKSTSVESKVQKFAEALNKDYEKLNLVRVFQEKTGFPYKDRTSDIPYEIEAWLNQTDDYSIEAIKLFLKSLDPDIFSLVEQIVRPDNLTAYMLRHLDPSEVSQQGGLFNNSFIHKGDKKGFLQERKEFVFIKTYSGKVLDLELGSNDPNLSQAHLMAKHAFLWFKKVPANIKFDFMYRKMWHGDYNSVEISSLLDYFGYNLYQINDSVLFSRSLYRIGDVAFSASRNVRYFWINSDGQFADKLSDVGIMEHPMSSQFRERKKITSAQYDDYKKEVYRAYDEYKTSLGTFSMTDLRGLFLYIFSDLFEQKKRNPLIKRYIVSMPADEVFEVTIFGKLSLKDVRSVPTEKTLESYDSKGLPKFPFANFRAVE